MRLPLHRLDRLYLPMVLLPIALVASLCIIAAVNWRSNRATVARSVEQIVPGAGGTPATAFTTWYEDQTSKRHTLELKQVAAAADDWYFDMRDAIEGNEHHAARAIYTPGTTEKESHEFVRVCAERGKPIYERLKVLAEQQNEVTWMPLVYMPSGELMTQMTNSGLLQVPQTEFLDAYHQGDSERAMETLEVLAKLASGETNGTGFGAYGFSAILTIMIRDSLSGEFWSAEELARIQELLSQQDEVAAYWDFAAPINFLIVMPGFVDRQYSDLVYQQRFAYRSSKNRKIASWSTIAPSELRDTAVALEAIHKIPDVGTRHHHHAITTMVASLGRSGEIRFQPDTWLKVPFMKAAVGNGMVASLQGLSQSMAISSNDIRWTRCAVAIKQFQLETGRLPVTLGELKQSRVDPSMRFDVDVDGEPYDYLILPESVDGKPVAKLWNHHQMPGYGIDGPPENTQVGLVFTSSTEIQ